MHLLLDRPLGFVAFIFLINLKCFIPVASLICEIAYVCQAGMLHLVLLRADYARASFSHAHIFSFVCVSADSASLFAHTHTHTEF